jgi:uracil-DNA glycosylase family 4
METETLGDASPTPGADPGAPPHDCALCPRLVEYRLANRAANPDWFNAPVPSFGAIDSPIVIIGMAPGVRGANRTGRPFTGDHAGILLYKTLLEFGLARGHYDARPDDGLQLVGCRIVNAVRCVPPANLPTPAETTTCNRFLTTELQRMQNLRVAVALGVLAHAAVLKACGIPQSHVRFRHGAIHELPDGLLLCDSYHVSRYNTNTGRLTDAMFSAVIRSVTERAAAPIDAA